MPALPEFLHMLEVTLPLTDQGTLASAVLHTDTNGMPPLLL